MPTKDQLFDRWEQGLTLPESRTTDDTICRRPHIAKLPVSGALPSNAQLDSLLNKLLTEMRHQDLYLAYRPTKEQRDKLRLVVWMWLTAEQH